MTSIQFKTENKSLEITIISFLFSGGFCPKTSRRKGYPPKISAYITVIYSLQFRFPEEHLPTPSLIHLTNKIRNEVGKGNYACHIFVDLQKAFHTIDQHILLEVRTL